SKEDDRFRPDGAGVMARVASCDHRVRQCCRNLFVGVNPLSSARQRRYPVIPVRRLPPDDVCHRLASPLLILLHREIVSLRLNCDSATTFLTSFCCALFQSDGSRVESGETAVMLLGYIDDPTAVLVPSQASLSPSRFGRRPVVLHPLKSQSTRRR